jgi:hypothetical protein
MERGAFSVDAILVGALCVIFFIVGALCVQVWGPF